MKTHFRNTIVAALVLMLVCGSAMAWTVNEHYTNNTGQTAYDCTKILVGHYTITDAMLNQPFANFTQMFWGPFTILHWDNGTVPPGAQGHMCFTTSSGTVGPYAALWTDAGANFIGIAGPVMTPNIGIDAGGNMVFKVGNNWHTWTGTAYPPSGNDSLGAPVGDVTIISAGYATDTVEHPLEELDSLNLEGLAWTDLPELVGVVGAGAEVQTEVAGDLQDGEVVLFMFAMEGPGGEQGYDVVQVPLNPTVPSLTHWGVILLLVLLVASAAYVLYRRRTAMVS